MTDPQELEKDADSFASLAKQHESSKQYLSSAFYYTEAAQALLNAISAGSRTPNLREKAQQFIKKAEELKGISSSTPRQSIINSETACYKADFSRAEYLINEAMSEDGKGNSEEAVILYTSAVELLLKLRSTVKDRGVLTKVETLAKSSLDRAEALKSKFSESTNPPSSSSQSAGGITAGSIQHNLNAKSIARRPNPNTQKGSGGYTSDELKVLRATSKINGREYLPFLDSLDLRERFALSTPFVDPDGLLVLSEKQKSQLERWVRPSEFIEHPKMIMAISCFSIRQTVVTDCSFVASIAVSAQYERRFKKRLITNIIYPQQKTGEAVYNPCGKYMIRLNVNGVPRKIIIDDRLPIDRYGQLLCSYSNNQSELWVSLLEKAYMKVMGGYDFPGSNSNIDLHALTGWIPERVAIRSDNSYFNKDKQFRILLDRFHRGHCLVTIATGQITEQDAQRAGLVPTHAYAMLDIQQIDNHRLFLLKNPWSHLRWKGNFSENDTRNWTPQLQAKLNFDISSAQAVDNGVFWIDYDSLCHFFDVFYINWNPELFQYTTCVHDLWLAEEGPKKDSYSSANNPQYRLEVNATVETPVWILLTRHITDKDDFADNKEFIAVVVYKDIKSRKVYYPYDPEPFRDSVRINSPHCLVKLLQDAGTVNYTLLISQYEKNKTIQYTLRVYSTAPFTLNKIVDPYKVVKQITGQWKGSNAGGSKNNPQLYDTNPCHQISFNNNDTDNQLLIELRGPRNYALGCELIRVSVTNPNAPNQIDRMFTGDYRRGYIVLEQSGLSGGIYNLVVSTYNSGQEGPYILTIKSLKDFTVKTIR